MWQLHENGSCQKAYGAPQYMSALQPALLAKSTRLLGIIPNNSGGFGNAEEALQAFMVDEISPIQTRIRGWMTGWGKRSCASSPQRGRAVRVSRLRAHRRFFFACRVRAITARFLARWRPGIRIPVTSRRLRPSGPTTVRCTEFGSSNMRALSVSE